MSTLKFNITAKKLIMFGWYTTIPSWVIDEMGHLLATTSKNITYIGNNTLQSHCYLQEQFGGRCWPPSGEHATWVDVGGLVGLFTGRYGGLGVLANGWYKVKVMGWGDEGRGGDLFCVMLKLRLRL